MTNDQTSNIVVFNRALQPDEKIVWQLMPDPKYWMLGLRVVLLIGVGVLLVAVFGTGGAVAYALVSAFVIMLQMSSWSQPLGNFLFSGLPAADEVYAITNQRILTHRKALIHALPLEQISTLVPASSQSLSFGPDFPTWNNLDDAQQVKAMIEQAQKERLKGRHS